MSATRSITDLISALPLKEMEASLLRSAILSQFDTGPTHKRVAEAIDLASYAHRAQTRQHRGVMPTVPYIEHPLRNAHRAQRYGVTDPDTIIAIILHDVVEDCSEIIASEIIASEIIASEICGMSHHFGFDARAATLAYIQDRFGTEVARIVHALTNPLLPDGLTRQQKNALYVEHVLAGILDLKVFIAKFVDFVDNALSLHHSVNPGMTQRLATKYLPLVEPFRARLALPDLTLLVPVEGVRQMLEHLDGNQLEVQAVLGTASPVPR
jgi:(p)ppGpp synthase/HD superfamily hydrolase